MAKELRFFLTIDGNQVEVNPVFNDLKIEDSPNNESTVLRQKFDGALTFLGKDFNLLLPIERSVNRCAPIPITVERLCGVNYVPFNSGVILLANASFNLDSCTIKAKLTKDDEYLLLDQNKDKELNIFEMGISKRTLNFQPVNTIPQTCIKTVPSLKDQYLTKCSGVDSAEWSLKSVKIEGSRVSSFNITTTWIKPASGGKVFTFMFPDRSSADTLPTTGDLSETQTFDFQYLGNEPFNFFDRCFRLDEVLIYLASQSNLTIRSDFFQINPANPSSINYVTGKPSLVTDLLLIATSDVQRPNSTAPTTRSIVTWEKIINDLKTIFNLDYKISNGILIIEEVSYFKNPEVFDLTASDSHIKWIKGKSQYSYDNDRQPSSETWKIKNTGSLPDAKGVPITYNNGCTLADRAKRNRDLETSLLCTDLYAILKGNTQVDSDGNIESSPEISRDTLVLIGASKQADGTYKMLSEPGILTPFVEPNNTLAISHIQDKYFRNNRSYRFGYLNNVLTTFDSSIKSKIGEPFKIPMCCGRDIDVAAGIKTFIGTGEIQKSVFNLADSMVELTVGYASDEFDSIEEQAPLANNDSVETKEEKAVLIDVVANDVNVGNSNVIITQAPVSGTAEVVGQKITYKPEVDFAGTDTIKYKLDKNGAFSNEATITIKVVRMPFLGNISIDDKYETPLNIPLAVNAANGVLANDGIWNRRGELVYNDQTVYSYDHVTVAGGSVAMQPDGSFIYNAPAGYQGIDTFYYVVYYPGYDPEINSVYRKVKVKIKVGEPSTPNYASVEALNLRAGTAKGSQVADIVCSFYYDQDKFFRKTVNNITVNYKISKKYNNGSEDSEAGSVTAINTNQVAVQSARVMSVRSTDGTSFETDYVSVIQTLTGVNYTPIN